MADDLVFDGNTLQWGDQSWPAWSGPWVKVSSTMKLPALPAEDEYEICPSELTNLKGDGYVDPETGDNKAVQIKVMAEGKEQPTTSTGHDGLFIHADGAPYPGTQGCIGIVAGSKSFFDKVKDAKDNPPKGQKKAPCLKLRVDYTHKPFKFIIHNEDILKCNHGGTVDLSHVPERRVEIGNGGRVVTDKDLLHQRIISCPHPKDPCLTIESIPLGLAKDVVMDGKATPVLGNLRALTNVAGGIVVVVVANKVDAYAFPQKFPLDLTRADVRR